MTVKVSIKKTFNSSNQTLEYLAKYSNLLTKLFKAPNIRSETARGPAQTFTRTNIRNSIISYRNKLNLTVKMYTRGTHTYKEPTENVNIVNLAMKKGLVAELDTLLKNYSNQKVVNFANRRTNLPHELKNILEPLRTGNTPKSISHHTNSQRTTIVAGLLRELRNLTQSRSSAYSGRASP
jgi:hypothetical protein